MLRLHCLNFENYYIKILKPSLIFIKINSKFDKLIIILIKYKFPGDPLVKNPGGGNYSYIPGEIPRLTPPAHPWLKYYQY